MVIDSQRKANLSCGKNQRESIRYLNTYRRVFSRTRPNKQRLEMVPVQHAVCFIRSRPKSILGRGLIGDWFYRCRTMGMKLRAGFAGRLSALHQKKVVGGQNRFPTLIQRRDLLHHNTIAGLFVLALFRDRGARFDCVPDEDGTHEA